MKNIFAKNRAATVKLLLLALILLGLSALASRANSDSHTITIHVCSQDFVATDGQGIIPASQPASYPTVTGSDKHIMVTFDEALAFGIPTNYNMVNTVTGGACRVTKLGVVTLTNYSNPDCGYVETWDVSQFAQTPAKLYFVCSDTNGVPQVTNILEVLGSDCVQCSQCAANNTIGNPCVQMTVAWIFDCNSAPATPSPMTAFLSFYAETPFRHSGDTGGIAGALRRTARHNGLHEQQRHFRGTGEFRNYHGYYTRRLKYAA